MRIAFSRLDIANIWKQNVTKCQLRQLLEEVTELGSCPKTYGSISFVFAGHGSDEVFCLQDEHTIEVQEVIDAFLPKKSPHLAAVPKLFFIDACRGHKSIRPLRVPAKHRETSLRCELQPQPSTFLIPPEGNCLTAFCTLAPYTAPDFEDGSEWIKILADTMCKSTDHIEEVLTQVRKDLHTLHQNPKFKECNMQMPETRSTLLQKVYLNRVARQPTRPTVSRRARAPEQPSRGYSFGSQFHTMYASQSFFQFEKDMRAFGRRESFFFKF